MGVNDIGFPLDVVGDHLAAAGGAFEPQRQNNWLFSVNLPGQEDITLGLESSALPSVAVEEIELHYLNIRRYVAGKAVYDTIPLVLKDMVDVGVASAIKEWHEQVYNPTTHKIGLARDYKKFADLILFGPDGDTERIWNLIGCWPISVNYGTLDMTSSEKVLIEATLRFDRAESTFF
jgi:hypothetical protein